MKTLGRIINERRRRFKLTTDQLSKKVGIDKSYLHQIERFDSEISQQIYSAFEVHLKLPQSCKALWVNSHKELEELRKKKPKNKKDETVYSWTKNCQEIKELGASPTLKSLQMIIQAAASADWTVRRVAAEVIGKHILGVQAKECLISLLDDKSDYVVRTACESISKLKIFGAREKILKLCNSKEPYTRLVALEAICSLWQEGDFDLFVDMFKNPFFEGARSEIASTLKEHADKSNWRDLFELWKKDQGPKRRLWACELAGLYGGTETKQELITFSKDKDGHVRRKAANFLSKI